MSKHVALVFGKNTFCICLQQSSPILTRFPGGLANNSIADKCFKCWVAHRSRKNNPKLFVVLLVFANSYLNDLIMEKADDINLRLFFLKICFKLSTFCAFKDPIQLVAAGLLAGDQDSVLVVDEETHEEESVTWSIFDTSHWSHFDIKLREVFLSTEKRLPF